MDKQHQHFQAIQISKNVYWVGAVDWQLTDFHGYKTSRGTTYNAFLILGPEPILIDTVRTGFKDEMLARINSVIDPKKVRYIISNHSEMDHSGCLPEIIDLINPKQIFASKTGAKDLKAHFAITREITAVDNNQELTLGDAKIKFIETKMLHWPDSMFSFYENDGVLFSQDAFGMHLATSKIFIDENDQSIIDAEAKKYFANILLPYASFVIRLIDNLPNLNLPLKMIAPDHGPIWRHADDIKQIIIKWRQWALQQPTAKIAIIYDTMWRSTELMANCIADGARSENVQITMLPLSHAHRSDIAAEVLTAGGIIVGSPTLNNSLFPTVADALCYLKGLKPQNLLGQAFGSFGWSGEATKEISEILTKMHVDIIGAPITNKYVPNDSKLLECRQMGKDFAAKLLTCVE